MRSPVAVLLAAALLSFGGAFAAEEAGAVTGTVRDSVTGQAVAGVKLTLMGGPHYAATETDEAGAFRLEKLVAGEYDVILNKVGYVGSNYRGFAARRVSVKAGDTVEALSIDLTPTGNIEGRVIGESGDALPGVTVTVCGLPATTDAKGRYRVEYLQPGPCKVQMNVPLDVRRRTAVRDAKSGELWGYPKSRYYPGVEAASAATDVVVPAGVTVQGFDLVLRRTRLVSWKGRVLDSASREAPPDTRVELSPEANQFSDDAYEPRGLAPDGGFEFEMIEPGPYRLLIFRGETKLPCVVRADIGPDVSAPVIWTAPPVSLQVRVKPPAGTDAPAGRLTVGLDPWPPVRGIRPLEIRVPAAGEFDVAPVPPGEYAVGAEWDGEKPEGWYVQGIRIGSQDVRAKPVAIAEGGTPPIEISIASEGGGRISGRVIKAAGRGPDSLIVSRVGDVYFRGPMSAIRTAPDGSFTITGLAPGEYVVQVPSGTSCAAGRAQVKVEGGATAQVRLEPCH